MTNARRMHWGLVAALAIVAVSLPAWLPTFTVQLTIRGLYLGIVTMTFILLAGYADMISLAQMSFAAISGYVIAIGTVRLGLSHGVLVPLAILGAVMLSALFGIVAIRGRKIYFLMMTLALGQLFYGVGMQWVPLTGGSYGYTGLSRPTLFGYSLVEATPLYYVTLVATALSYLALRRVVHSNFGLVLQGIRDNPRRMAALGFNVQLHRYVVIIISGAFAGVSGILNTYFTGVISPSRAGLSQSVMVVMAALLGGVGKLEGGLLGGTPHGVPSQHHERTDRSLLDGHRHPFHPARLLHAERAAGKRSKIFLAAGAPFRACEADAGRIDGGPCRPK